jgi:hypothetical protein
VACEILDARLGGDMTKGYARPWGNSKGEHPMFRKTFCGLALLAALVPLAGVKAATSWLLASNETKVAQAGSPQTFTGEIMDSACAAKGSHDAMMKQEGAKDAQDCTLDCVNHGSKFVLYDAASKTIYQLSDQGKAKNYAGQKVKVTGTSDRTTNTSDVENIDAA